MAEKPVTKKAEKQSIGSRVVNLFRSTGSDDPTAKGAQQPTESENHPYTTNGGASGTTASQTQTLTLTEKVQKTLPTLILQLKGRYEHQFKSKSENEQEEYLNQHIHSFRDMIFRNIDEFKAIILSARPSPASVNDPNYEEQKAAYHELLKAAMALMDKMQETLNTVLTDYRIFIEDLWEAISNGKDPNPISERFQQKLEAFMKQSWDPVFAKADQMMQDIENSRQSHNHKKTNDDKDHQNDKKPNGVQKLHDNKQ